MGCERGGLGDRVRRVLGQRGGLLVERARLLRRRERGGLVAQGAALLEAALDMPRVLGRLVEVRVRVRVGIRVRVRG